MSGFGEMFSAMDRMTPTSGFNLVGVDTFEKPGEELFLVGHYAKRDEAIAALRKKRSEADPDFYKYYVYAADGEEPVLE